jgi:hypothetical protein
MWNKIYTAALGISFLLMAGLAYYASTWLQSSTKPADVVTNYDYHSNIVWMFLWASSIILLVLGNVVLWTTRNAWAMWATFLYFAFFILLQTLWLDQSFLSYKQNNGLGNGAISFGFFYGILFCVLAAVIVFFNQFIVKRMRDKVSAQTQPVSENQSETKTDLSENNI